MAEKKKVSRIMKVSMTEDEFKKFDKGETHSDSGVRNKKGRLSALPDIEEISEDELPTREVVRTEVIREDYCVETKEHSLGEKLAEGTANIIVDVLTDPEVQESIGLLFKALWRYKIVPKISKTVKKWKDVSNTEGKTLKTATSQAHSETDKYEFELINDKEEKIKVSGETAETLVKELQKKAKELAAMIFLLSNIVVKDKKTAEEYTLESSYIKELVSEEAKHTMRVLVANEQILDKEVVICFSDFLNGYLRNGENRIPIPLNGSH